MREREPLPDSGRKLRLASLNRPEHAHGIFHAFGGGDEVHDLPKEVRLRDGLEPDADAVGVEDSY